MDATLILTTKSQTFTQQVSPTTTLEDILVFFEVQDGTKFEKAMLSRQDYVKTHFLSYTGIPDTEELGPKHEDGSSVMTIQYNVAGLMQPKLQFDNNQVFQVDKDQFDQIQLSTIYPTFPTTIHVTLTHIYTTNHLSKKQQQDAIDSVLHQFQSQTQNIQYQAQNGTNTTQSVQNGQKGGNNGTNRPLSRHEQQMKDLEYIQELIDINEIMGDIEAKHTFLQPKVIVSARIQYPPKQKVDKNDNKKNTMNNNDSDEDDDSDNDDDSSDDDEMKENNNDDVKSPMIDIITPQATQTLYSTNNNPTTTNKTNSTTSTTQNQNDKKSTRKNKMNDDSDVQSEEVTDSDDDEFYTHNKHDYRVIHKIYTQHRQELKKQAQSDKEKGIEPMFTVPDSDDDDNDNDNDTIGPKQPNTNTTSNVIKTSNQPKSLAELAKELKLKKKLEGNKNGNKNEQKDDKNNKPPSITPLGRVFKTKDGKHCAASVTYRFRFPTIFYPVGSEQIEKNEKNNENQPKSVENEQNQSQQLPLLVLNISIQLNLPSSTSIQKLYQIMSTLLSSPITQYITQNMGSTPSLSQLPTSTTESISTQSNTTNSTNSTVIDQYPFILVLGAPPYTQLQSKLIVADKKRFPLGIETTMRNLLIQDRSSFSFHWRHIYKQATTQQGQNSQTDQNNNKDDKEPINLVSFLQQQHQTNNNIDTLLNKNTTIDEKVLLQKSTILQILAPIITHIDDFSVSK